jgi:hypothetical protein
MSDLDVRVECVRLAIMAHPEQYLIAAREIYGFLMEDAPPQSNYARPEAGGEQ